MSSASGGDEETEGSLKKAGDAERAEPSEEGKDGITCSTGSESTAVTSGKTRNEIKSSEIVKKKKGKVTTVSSADNPSKNHSSSSTPKSSFEEELDWCVAQLELGMLRPGASKQQKQQNERNICTLQASKTPVPKKRQLMRSLFGDYRSKMKLQPLPESLVTKETRLEAAKPEVIETVGTYYRRSTGLKSHDDIDSGFKFNFSISSK